MRSRNTNARRASRRDEMLERQAKWRERFKKLSPQLAFVDVIRAELPEDGIYVDEVTQVGFAARLAFPAYKPRTFLSPGYQDNLGWGYATALGAQCARPDVPVALDQRRRRLPLHRQRARHRHAPPHSAGGGGIRGWRLRQCAAHPAGAVRQPGDRVRPRQPRFRQICRKLRRRRPARADAAGAGRRAQGRFRRPRADFDRGAGWADALAHGNSSTCRACAASKGGCHERPGSG